MLLNSAGVSDAFAGSWRVTEVSLVQSPTVGKKPTKRVNILYRCTETGKAHYAPCKRAKKFELVDR